MKRKLQFNNMSKVALVTFMLLGGYANNVFAQEAEVKEVKEVKKVKHLEQE